MDTLAAIVLGQGLADPVCPVVTTPTYEPEVQKAENLPDLVNQANA